MMNDRQQTSDDWEELKKSRTHAPPPHALTREQVETTISRFLSWHDCEPECAHDLREVLATDAAQRRTIEQQAQEIERLQVELLASRSHVEAWSAQVQKERNTLAAMTAERDEWKRKSELVTNDPDYQQCCQVREQAQARVGEIEAEKQSSDFLRKRAFEELQKQVATSRQLQAILAERERDIAKLKAELNETFVDEKETVWTRPTAWAYAMVCKARDKHEQEAGRMRNNVELMARDMCSMPSDLYQEWLDSDSQVHFRQWLAERALKGDE